MGPSSDSSPTASSNSSLSPATSVSPSACSVWKARFGKLFPFEDDLPEKLLEEDLWEDAEVLVVDPVELDDDDPLLLPFPLFPH